MKARNAVQLLVIAALLLSLGAFSPAARSSAQGQPASPGITGPFFGQAGRPYVWNGDLRDLPQFPGNNPPQRTLPAPRPTGRLPEASPSWQDPLAQTRQGTGQMPAPIMDFPGLDYGASGGWHPPDTNGDVGPTYYVQAVNIALGIYDKATGQELVSISYDDLFTGTGTPCDDQNRGDVVALYDPLADRWLVSDFSLPSGGPYYQCIGVSQTGDPISGGWYFYALVTGQPGESWNDYPKFGVWPDAYYLTANMFDPWIGANIWALDRASMLVGGPLNWVMFNSGSQYGSLLPANLRGTPPPAGSPNYLASIDFPDTLHIWEFHVDWANPGDSTFTGPVDLTVADWGFVSQIPQKAPGTPLDSLGDRLMMSLHYRNMGSYESLWVNHTVASGDSAGVRWYEVRDPGGTPVLYQQGTYQPDDNYRWMGSVATDQDGNMAAGYSVSSENMYPAIRYAGRLNGEVLGSLPQGEASLIEGTGAQVGQGGRWGDYSAMTVDPTDDCTFWYTQEYYEQNGGDWQTRIGSFKFPSCGQPKGWIGGNVYDAVTLAGLPGAPVVAQGGSTTMTVETDANGDYTMALPGGTYTLTAGPLLPGYPDPAVTSAIVTVGATTTANLALVPQPNLVTAGSTVDDDVPGGNHNGYAEPGETGLLFWEAISNTGATTATTVSAHLVAQTPGVTVTVADADYPDIAVGQAQANLTPFEFSIALTIPCGGRLDFDEILTTDQGVYTAPVRLYVGVPQPIAPFFSDDMENGSGNWTTGGTNNLWAITTEQSHSPSHAWSDSPYGNYLDNTDSWLRSPIFDLSSTVGTGLTFWHRYSLEDGYDFGYVEYSLDGGTTWKRFPVNYTGSQAWNQQSIATAIFDGWSDVAFRFRITSDGGVTADGWYIDDVALSYQPFACYYPAPAVPTLLSPPDGTITASHAITFTWEPGAGGGEVQGYNLDLDGTVITTTDPSAALSLTAGMYAWRVRAFNDAGPSDYTISWTLEILDPPAVPTLLTPPDGTLFTTTHDVTLTWEAGAGWPVESYTLDLDGSVISTTATTWTGTLVTGTHTWQVSACNKAGCSEATAPWSFEILDAPGTPVLVSPPDGAVFTTTHEVTFVWQPGSGCAPAGYDLLVNGAVLTTTADTALTTTLAAGTYTWTVRAWNAAGQSAYSEPQSLLVVDPAGVPVLVSPADGTFTTTATITLTWTAGPGGTPDGYNVELDGTVITTTGTVLTATLDSGPHAWRVRAFNLAGYSGYSDPWMVTVAYRVYLPLVARGFQAP
jgi:hypothetical protein